MFLVDSEVADLVREKYAKVRPDWTVLDISLVARKFGGFLAVVVCERSPQAEPEGVARFSDEICYVSSKGEVTCFHDIASFANFLIWYERRPTSEKWLTPILFFRCAWVVALIAASYGLDTAFEGGSPLLAILVLCSVISFGLLVIFQPRE